MPSKSTFYVLLSNIIAFWVLGAVAEGIRLGYPPIQSGVSYTNLFYY